MNSLSTRLFIAVLLMLMLTIIPLPPVLQGLRPCWVLMLVLYLQYFLPAHFNVFMLFLIGFVMDILLSTVLGEHAFALGLAGWIANHKTRRFNLFSLEQQITLVGLFCLCYKLVILIIDTSQGYPTTLMTSLTGVLTSMLLWPWIKLWGDNFLLRFRSVR